MAIHGVVVETAKLQPVKPKSVRIHDLSVHSGSIIFGGNK